VGVVTVDDSTSVFLRIADPVGVAAGSVTEPGAMLAEVCQAFELALGWRLECGDSDNDQHADLMWSAPAEPGVGAPLRLVKVASDLRLAGSSRPAPAKKAIALASAIARLWSETCSLREGLVEREAELASDIPVVAKPEAPAKSAERINAVLKAGAEAVGCHAAGLYLLDSATTSLKLRACWGLPERRLAGAPRPLRGALADLEALLGHAVVLAEPAMFEYWRAPEPCGAAVCVPVSSSTTPLGTLWVYSHATRDFSNEQTNLLEVIAGRLATELERDVLLADARATQGERRQLAAATQRASESRPRIAPLIDGWKVAGRMLAQRQRGGAFFDWFATADEQLAITLGTAVEEGFSGALSAAELRSALRAQAPDLSRSSQALHCAHEVLAGMSAENVGVSAFCGLLDPARDTLRFSAAGSIRVMLADSSRPSVLNEPAPPIGGLDSVSIVEISRRLTRGAILAAYAIGGAAPAIADWNPIDEGLAELLACDLHAGERPQGVERLADLAAESMRRRMPTDLAGRDGALLIVRRG
jgi:hypothetical protein